MKTKRILILITHGLGELDVLFPLLCAIKKKYNCSIDMIFCINSVYYKYLENEFYISTAKKINIQISKWYIPNKFDKQSKSKFKIFRLISRIQNLITIAVKTPFLIYKQLNQIFFFTNFQINVKIQLV